MGSIVPMSMAMTPENQSFGPRLGQRIAERRKGCGLARQQLADTPGISRQALAHHEVGRRRVSASMLGRQQAFGVEKPE